MCTVLTKKKNQAELEAEARLNYVSFSCCCEEPKGTRERVEDE